MPSPVTGPVSRFVLNGKIATMDANATVIDDGYLCIDQGEIKAVVARKQDILDAFDDAPLIRSGGTIFPGFIEMHNHLPYNILPMWPAPKRYDHRGQWSNAHGKRTFISTPMSVLGKLPGYGPAIARYVEAKCLMGGTTTSQGITLFSNSGIGKMFAGVTRNVEKPIDPDLPKAKTKVADINDNSLDGFHNSLQSSTCFLLHLSEGVGDLARKHFLVLEKDDGTWALERSLTGIHSTGLIEEDFEKLAAVGASIAWSPLSNLLLYGGTTDVAAAKRARVNITLGSDWSPSGSKNLLAELKIAKAVSDAGGGIFSDEELLQLATNNAAKALQWDHKLGSLEVGKRADLVVVRGRAGNPYERILDARETSLSMVMIDGVARAGTPSLVARLNKADEEIRIGRSRRSLCLIHEDPTMAFGDLTLATATTQLAHGLATLPERQTELENLQNIPIGAPRPDPTMPIDAAPSQRTDAWVLFDDHDEDGHDHDEDELSRLGLFDYAALDPDIGPIRIGASRPVILEPMILDPLTTVDDRTYYTRIKAALNVPDFIRQMDI
ncbi:MAG: amidohydrolase family protein [Sulfitobacter sp.]